MTLTNEQEATKEVANNAYNCGEQVGVELNAMVTAIEPMLAGRFQGNAANAFNRIQAELGQQVEKLNAEMDRFAETLIRTTDGLNESDLELNSQLESAWEGSDTNSAYESQLSGGGLK